MGLRDNLVTMVIGHMICIGLVAVPVLLFFLVGKPYKRGFFCDDESLMHPYHESTVTSTVLYFYGFGIPITTFFVVEMLRSKGGQPDLLPQSDKPFLMFKVPGLIQNIYHNVWPFLMGAAIQQMITDIAKYTVGRLRPHFFAVCNPRNLEELCRIKHKYVEEFECNSDYSAGHIKEMRLSFPSGHSSFSMFCMLWTVLYLQKRVTCPCVNVQAVKLVFQSALFYLAWYTAMSRISDYKHHWSDVLSGMLIGLVICLTVFFKIAPVATFGKLYRRHLSGSGDDCCTNTQGNYHRHGCQNSRAETLPLRAQFFGVPSSADNSRPSSPTQGRFINKCPDSHSHHLNDDSLEKGRSKPSNKP